jgi:hypothetical protein
MTQQLEAKYVAEWLREFHPTALQWKRQRLGLFPDTAAGRMFSVVGKWVDAIYYENGTVYLVEAKLRQQSGAVSQLEIYLKSFGETPNFTDYWNFPRKGILLVTRVDNDVRDLAAEKNIEYIVYKPEWLKLI